MPQKAFYVTVRGCDEGRTIYADSAGQAKAEMLRDVREPWPDVQYTDMRAKFIGVRETPVERMQREAAQFNASYPIGTPIRVYPGRMGDHASAYDTTVMEPGAFILGGHTAVVKVPGDCIALTHAVPLVPLARTAA